MARPTPSMEKMQSWIKDIPEIEFDKGALYCRTCQESLVCNQKTQILKHLATEKHKSTGGKSQTNFNLELTEVMVACNIPWKQLSNPILRQFLQRCLDGEYTNVTIPAETTLRRNYLPPTCANVKAKIFSELSNKYIWASVDEATNSSGRILVNVMVGAMDENSPTPMYLIACKVLETTDENTVANIVHSSLKELWGNKYKDNIEKLLLFITDVAPYMQHVGAILKQTYVNMLHMTCLIHALNNLAVTIGSLYLDVSNLISSGKKVFSEVHCINRFRENHPTVELPPEPIFTCPVTWLEAATYYYTNFDGIKGVVQELDVCEGFDVSNVQELFNSPTVYEDLTFIQAHFSRLSLAIRQLEKSSSTLTDAMNVLFDLRHYLRQLSGSVVEAVMEKFQTVLDNNPGFTTMCLIVDMLNGKEVDFSIQSVDVAPLKHFTYFKYAPVTATDIEKSFSELRDIFMDKRRNFTAEHLESLMIVYYNES